MNLNALDPIKIHYLKSKGQKLLICIEIEDLLLFCDLYLFQITFKA